MDIPERPLVFGKFSSCISGPTDDVVLACDSADWEVELVVVIGATAHKISRDQVWSHVLGLTVGQDVSDRKLQFAAKPPHFDLGKSRDTYGPLGPILVSPDRFDDPDDIRLTCSVNGEMKQDGRTSDLIFDVADLVVYLADIMTLRAGDVIFTGTPAGVGVASGTYLQPGDVIVSEIDGIGQLRNVCR